MADAIGGRAVQQIGQEPVAVRGHRDQIHLLLLGGPDQLRRRIAHRQLRLHLQAARGQLVAQLSR